MKRWSTPFLLLASFLSAFSILFSSTAALALHPGGGTSSTLGNGNFIFYNPSNGGTQGNNYLKDLRNAVGGPPNNSPDSTSSTLPPTSVWVMGGVFGNKPVQMSYNQSKTADSQNGGSCTTVVGGQANHTGYGGGNCANDVYDVQYTCEANKGLIPNNPGAGDSNPNYEIDFSVTMSLGPSDNYPNQKATPGDGLFDPGGNLTKQVGMWWAGVHIVYNKNQNQVGQVMTIAQTPSNCLPILSNGKLNYDDGTGNNSHELTNGFLIDVYQTNPNDKATWGDLDKLSAAATAQSTREDQCAQNNGVLGWIVCPIFDGISQTISDMLKDFIQPLLVVDINAFSTKGNIYGTWSHIKDVADVFLVLVFMFIIFANALSFNVDAYTIKKLLPRLVAAAILMQLSFLICSLIIDIGNIFGSGISGIISAVAVGSSSVNAGNIVLNLGLFAVLFALALIFWPLILPLFLMILIVVVAFMIVIAARFFLIGIFVMISPLAFVAWVLPNTEKYFKIWYTTFFRLVLIYPIIMALLALAHVMDQIIPTAEGSGSFAGSGIATDVIKLLFFIVILGAIPWTFKWAGGLMAMASNQIGKLQGGTLKAYRKSDSFKDKQAQARANRRGLAAGTGVTTPTIMGRNLTLGRGRIGRGFGRVITGDPTGRNIYRNQSRDLTAAKKWLEDNGLDTRGASEMLLMSDADFRDKLKNGTDAEKQTARSVQSIRGRAPFVAQAALNFTDKGGNIDVRSESGVRAALERTYGTDSAFAIDTFGQAAFNARERQPAILSDSRKIFQGGQYTHESAEKALDAMTRMGVGDVAKMDDRAFDLLANADHAGKTVIDPVSGRSVPILKALEDRMKSGRKGPQQTAALAKIQAARKKISDRVAAGKPALDSEFDLI